MLSPHDRTLLLDALRPPERYRLDEAIGTTFSLDLLALLTAPVGFTGFELQESDGAAIGAGDALLLLRTIRRYAERLTVFCQAGQIADPPGHHLLLTTLEPCVVEVTAPEGGVFHPKVWVLRYVLAEPDPELAEGEEDEDGPSVRYRVLILSRNLTFDRSWDTVLTLDGVLTNRSLAIAANRPLADFVAALPDRATRTVDGTVSQRAARMADELLRVRFELPKGIDAVRFHPLGIAGYRRWPFPQECARLLVVSPFIGRTLLATLAGTTRRPMLVSRVDTLGELPAEVLKSWDAHALSPDADVPDADTAADTSHGDASTDDVGAVAPSGQGLRGLHAKLYVADEGWKARIWTGSANATTAAFHRNVEFLAELQGKRSVCGVDAVLGVEKPGATSLRSLLEAYTPGAADPDALTVERQLERALDAARHALAARGWRAIVAPAADAGGWDLELAADEPLDAAVAATLASVTFRPVSLGAGHARRVDLRTGEPMRVRFPALSVEALTGFMVATIEVRVAEASCEGRFVLTAALQGAPADRAEVILRHLLRDRAQVMRFLLLLLTDDAHALAPAESGASWRLPTGVEPQGAALPHEALLEPLLRALHREPSRLDEVAQVARDLSPTSSDDPVLLPEGFDAVVGALRTAREALR